MNLYVSTHFLIFFAIILKFFATNWHGISLWYMMLMRCAELKQTQKEKPECIAFGF